MIRPLPWAGFADFVQSRHDHKGAEAQCTEHVCFCATFVLTLGVMQMGCSARVEW